MGDTDASRQTEDDVNKKNYVAEIGMSRDGHFVYCSNRGLDTLAIFKVANDGTLKAINYVSTFGKTPRHFSISPDNEWLIGANQDSNNLVVFRRNAQNGTLQMHKKYDNVVCAPNFVLFAPINKKQKNEKNNFLQALFLLIAIFCGIAIKISLF